MLRFFRHTLPWQTRFFIRDPTTVLRPAAIGNGFFTIRCSTAGHLTLHSRRILANQQKLHVRIYTRTGDKGLSSLFTGERRPKTDPVFQALGTIDELSSTIAVALAHIDEHLKIIKPTNDVANLRDQLEQIQRRLQALGSAVATPLSESTIDEEGGGGGGTIRDAGDAFGRREAQLEEEYFYRKNREQLEALRRHLEEEVKYRAEEIERHKEAIERHEKLLKDLDKGK